MSLTIYTHDDSKAIGSSYRTMTNIAARDEIIQLANTNGIRRGRGQGGQYFFTVKNAGQTIVGYHPRENMTYFHAAHGVLVHEEPGDMLGLAIEAAA